MENSQNTNQEPVQTTPPTESPQPTPVQETTPTPSDTPQSPEPNVLGEKEHSSVGPIIASIIIIILIVIGGIYFWGAILNDSGYTPSQDSEAIVEDDSKTNDLNNQGTSDDVSDIEADLQATDVDGLEGNDLDLIDAQF